MDEFARVAEGGRRRESREIYLCRPDVYCQNDCNIEGKRVSLVCSPGAGGDFVLAPVCRGGE
jgi:hypothetical protein